MVTINIDCYYTYSLFGASFHFVAAHEDRFELFRLTCSESVPNHKIRFIILLSLPRKTNGTWLSERLSRRHWCTWNNRQGPHPLLTYYIFCMYYFCMSQDNCHFPPFVSTILIVIQTSSFWKERERQKTSSDSFHLASQWNSRSMRRLLGRLVEVGRSWWILTGRFYINILVCKSQLYIILFCCIYELVKLYTPMYFYFSGALSFYSMLYLYKCKNYPSWFLFYHQ